MKDTVKVPWKAYILNAFCTVLIFVALSGMIEAKVIDKYIQGIIMLVFVNIILAVSLNPVSYTHLILSMHPIRENSYRPNHPDCLDDMNFP